MKKNYSSSAPSSLLRKLALYGTITLFSLYGLGVAGGYSWLHFVRKNDQVRLLDVALFRLTAIRRSIAVQHFANAQVEWDAKNYQAAYLLFSAGVRQDPNNSIGRLTAVKFLRSLGAGSLALTMLEEGLALAPGDRRLIEPTFDYLLVSSRERRALDLLRKQYAAELSGPHALLLQRYEVEATLKAEGAPAAKKLLDKHPGLLKESAAVPVVARVLWESQERLRAMNLIQEYLSTQSSAGFPEFALLAGWQKEAGLAADAVRTARKACERFSREISPRVLLIEMVAADTGAATAVPEAISAYLREFGSRPEALAELAVLAGRNGWVDLGRTLYENGANRQADMSMLALSYSDGLARGGHFKEVRQILLGLEMQAPETNAAFMAQLRQRQVIAAAALGDSDNVREYARRLAAVLRSEPDGLEACRRLFGKMGITEAVAELSSRSLTASNAGRK